MKQHQHTGISRLGKLIAGHYLLHRVLGTGSMGTVYEAEDQRDRRRVAIKVLHSMYRHDEEAVHRFRQEASVAQQLAHPNIIQVEEVGQESLTGSLYMIQEFLIGQSLREVLDAQGRLGVRLALDVAVPIMGALVAAHDRGVLHRDVKPENIFLARVDAIVPKLIDFGVAKMLHARVSEPLTEAGYALGTPSYMSPEQIRGERSIDARSDVWAMGVLLYEMLAGRCPFQQKSLVKLAAQIRDGAAEPLEQAAPDIPPELCRIVHAALRPSRNERWMSMRLFVDALLDSKAVGDLGATPRWQLRRYRMSLVHRAVTDDEELNTDRQQVRPGGGRALAADAATGEAAAGERAEDRAAARRWLQAVGTGGVPLGTGITPVVAERSAPSVGAGFSPPPSSLTPTLTPTMTPTDTGMTPLSATPEQGGPRRPGGTEPSRQLRGGPRSVAPVPDADFYSDLDAAGAALGEQKTRLIEKGRRRGAEPGAGAGTERGREGASGALQALRRQLRRFLRRSDMLGPWLVAGALAVALLLAALLVRR